MGSNPTATAIVVSRDIVHRCLGSWFTFPSPFGLGVLWFLGLVVAVWVEGQLSEELPGLGVDDADVLVVDEDFHAGVFMCASDADVV